MNTPTSADDEQAFDEEFERACAESEWAMHYDLAREIWYAAIRRERNRPDHTA